MASLVEDGSLQIDHYVYLTEDWARTPDGHYYSNKAPGPALLAYPLFYVFDFVATLPLHHPQDRQARDSFREKYAEVTLRFLAVVLQVLPMMALVLFATQWLQGLGVSPLALQLTAVTLLFGHTASLFMNTYFGHGLAAMAVLALFLALAKRQPVLIGFFAGAALLCDFGAALILPWALLIAAFQNRQTPLLGARGIILGALLPAAAWSSYHIICFGSPLTIAQKFVNPAFVDHTNAAKLWGLVAVPQLETIISLLIGSQRGIWWTQPWVFIAIVAAPWVLWQGRQSRQVWETADATKVALCLALPSLALLLAMNASYNDWWAGSSPGPRYLSSIFPVFAMILGLTFDRLPRFGRWLWPVCLIFPIGLLLSTYNTDLFINLEPLWPAIRDRLIAGYNPELLYRGCICVAAMLASTFLAWRRVAHSV